MKKKSHQNNHKVRCGVTTVQPMNGQGRWREVERGSETPAASQGRSHQAWKPPTNSLARQATKGLLIFEHLLFIFLNINF